MPLYFDTVMVDGRLVAVTLEVPEGISVLNLQELAEKAWRSDNKTITLDRVTVKVRAFVR